MADDLALARKFTAYASGLAEGFECRMTFRSPEPLRQAARALERQHRLQMVIDAQGEMIAAQQAVIDAARREAVRQRLWALFFAGLAVFSTLLAVQP